MKEVQYTGKEKAGRFFSGAVSLSGVVALGLIAYSIIPNMDVVKSTMTNDLKSGVNTAVVEQSDDIPVQDNDYYDAYQETDQEDAAQAEQPAASVDTYQNTDQEDAAPAEQTTVSVMDAVYGKVIAEYQSVLKGESDWIRYYVVPTLTKEDYPRLVIEKKYQPNGNQDANEDMAYASQLFTTVSVYSWSQSRLEIFCDMNGRKYIQPTIYTGITKEHYGDLIEGYHDQRSLFVAYNDESKPQTRYVDAIEGYCTYTLSEDDPALTPVTPHTNISELKQAFYDAVQS